MKKKVQRGLAFNQIQHALRKRNGRVNRIPKPKSPVGLEREYLRDILTYVKAFDTQVRSHIVRNLKMIASDYDFTRPLKRADTASDDLKKLTRDVKKGLNETFDPDRVRRMALSRANEVSKFNETQVKASVSSALGIDVFINQPYLEDELAMFVSENVDLIESISEDALSKIQNMVFEAFRGGTRVEDLASQIEDYVNPDSSPVRSRAALIARDQVGKLNGQLNFLRQSELGIDSYTWRTVGDERVRDTHRAHDGNVYDWSSPPADTGHPGEDYQCRCWAEPIIEELDEDTEDDQTNE